MLRGPKKKFNTTCSNFQYNFKTNNHEGVRYIYNIYVQLLYFTHTHTYIYIPLNSNFQGDKTKGILKF